MKDFFALIDQLIANPQQKSHIQAQIWQKYGYKKAVLALDMSGFSLTVRREGIIAYLAKIRIMQHITQPLVTHYQGEIIKYEADNLLAVFDDCQLALEAAIAIRDHCLNQQLPVSIGLDYGRILLIPEQDCYGDTVNIAHKLGEDVAQANEILISDAIKQQLQPSATLQFNTQYISISGVEFLAYQVVTPC